MGLTEEDIQQRDEGPGLVGLFAAMGNSEADPEALLASEDGRLITERMVVMSMPEGSEEEKVYWRNFEKGLIKEVHGEGLDKWASYIPVSSETAADRRYPLVFCLHGAHNPIHLTETYGIIQTAAREECIVIAPENENQENISALYDFALANYPVDPSRVYCMGYSFGGFMTARNVLSHPERFAGAGMGGMLFANDVIAHDLDGQWYPEFHLTEEMIERTAAAKFPAVICMGENEMLNLLPLWREPEGEVRDGVIPLDSASKKRSFNNWRRACGCEPAAFLAPGEEGHPVEQAIGARFERCEIREYHGRKYYIGDCLTPEGEARLRVIACEKMVHWAPVTFGDLLFEHLMSE